MTLWVEVRSFQERVGKPFFVELDKLNETQYLGFRSVYAYPDHVKAAIEHAGSTANLAWAPVYSDCLFLDFDNCPEAASELLLYLYDEEVAHEAYSSGNRSVHVHVWLEPAEGQWVPYSQRVWVSRQAPQADVTFYHAAGQFRLPGTMHTKTGRRKVMERQLHGSRLVIPRVDRPAPATPVGTVVPGAFMAQLLRHKGEGERRVYAWHLAKQAAAEGMAYDAALAHLLWWNTRHCKPPLPGEIVEAKLQEVYKRHG